MASNSQQPISEVGPWAKDKLDRLRKYLSAYTTILSQKNFDGFYYIDAFAGPGEHEIRTKQKATSSTKKTLIDVGNYAHEFDEQRRFLDGSPRVALDVDPPFTAYVFVEKNPTRIVELRKLQEEYEGRRQIRIRQSDCNTYLLEQVVNNPRVNWKRNRAVAFVDPFGMQVPWTTLKALGETKAIEVFLNFPVGMAIQRCIPKNPQKLTARRRQLLDDYFGTPEWFNVVYETKATLFGDEEKKLDRSARALLKWYQTRLKEAFGYVSDAALITNTKKGHLYYLLLASPNKTGAKIASHILGGGKRLDR